MGVSKTSLGGVAILAVAIYAMALPTRESTAALLLVLLVGDLLAVSTVGRHADRSLLRGLLPGPIPGLVLGAGVLAIVDDQVLRIGIGVVLLILVIATVVLDRCGFGVRRRWNTPGRIAVGGAAGVITMIANAAGPVMALYLVSEGVDKRRFVGTSAWFFLAVNLIKVPFSVGVGLLRPSMLVAAVVLAPAVLLGALAGSRLLRTLDQRTFETAALVAAGVSAVPLLFA